MYIGDIMNKQKAFTLSEVLITLTILGIIAAVIIPSIHRSFQDRIQITGMKRAYSILENAFQIAFANEGNIYTWNWPDGLSNTTKNSNYLAEVMTRYISTAKYCGSASGCFPNRKAYFISGNPHPFYKALNGTVGQYNTWTEANRHGKILLKNGMAMSFGLGSWSLNVEDRYDYGLGHIMVDINGENGPNRYGYDVFVFTFNENGIKTSGKNLNYQCNYSHKDDLNYSCNKDSIGCSCSIWVLRHNNMDYKRRDVSGEW